MRAFVLGGGGNLGAMQVGALKALYEQGIRPDFLLGCSVGALNATMLACDYSEASIDRLQRLWKNVTVRDIFPGSKLSYAWRFLTRRDGLCDNRRLYDFLINSGIDPHETFGQAAGIPLYVTATNLTTGKLDIFGQKREDYLIDALMATSAQSPLLPPWEVNGVQYVDGGTVTPLPLRCAIELGATEIYSLRMEHDAGRKSYDSPSKPVRGMTGIAQRSVTMMIQQQAEYDLLIARNRLDVSLHEIELAGTVKSRTDFSQSHVLCEEGYEIMSAYLERRAVRKTQPMLVPDSASSEKATSNTPLPNTLIPQPANATEEPYIMPIALSTNELYATGD